MMYKTKMMRSKFTQISLFLLLFIGLQAQAQEIKWLSWEEAVKLSETDAQPKKMFIDVYADWCGWCKKMDKETFQNPEVAKYMQENFYMVKLNGEGKEPIVFRGNTFEYVPSGRRGYHELAAALLQGRLSYPSTVFMDEDLKILTTVPGFQTVGPFMEIARYFGDNIYKDMDWKSYAGQ